MTRRDEKGRREEKEGEVMSHLEKERTWVNFLFQPLSYMRGVSMAHSQESACTYLGGRR
jgi:hypothetical protein